MKNIIFHICLGMRGKNIWMSQFLYPKQWGRRELFSRRRRIRGLVPAAQEALVFGGGSAGHCGARTGIRWVHPSHHRCWPPCLRWCCPQQGRAPGQRDADLPEDPFSYHWVICKSTLWSRSMLKTLTWWVDKCRDTWLLWQLVEIQAGLAQARWAGLCCTQCPRAASPWSAKRKWLAKRARKNINPVLWAAVLQVLCLWLAVL